jgi:hypothetical protein
MTYAHCRAVVGFMRSGAPALIMNLRERMKLLISMIIAGNDHDFAIMQLPVSKIIESTSKGTVELRILLDKDKMPPEGVVGLLTDYHVLGVIVKRERADKLLQLIDESGL